MVDTSFCIRRATSVAVAPRTVRGLRLIKKRPLFNVALSPSTPIKELTLSAAGSRKQDVESPFGKNVEAGAVRQCPAPDQPCAEHRHESERNDRRDHNRDGECDRKFVEQAADHIAHE